MALHMLKMCVGINSVAQLRERQGERLGRLEAAGQPARLAHWTRNFPRRAAQILDGGSLYWIIRGQVRVRQRITSLDCLKAEGTGKRCAIILDADLIETVLQPRRPMQGWRYFEPEDVPADLSPGAAAEAAAMPVEMAEELRELGLL
jgi:hypothetical protein|tara:strand:- start:1593 stop:2033 length:441 start_codon:yes stop_codon:yes gene_type:complete